MVDFAELELRIKSLEAVQATRRLADLEKRAQTAERAVDRLNRRNATASRVKRRLARDVRGLNRVFAPLLGTLVAVAGATAGIRTLSQYGETMAQVRGIAISTTAAAAAQEAQFARLAAQTRQLGADTRFSATEAAEGQLFLARAGFQVNEIISALPGTLDLAASGAIDLGRAADIASNVLSQFRLEAEEMNRVGDILTTTFTRSNTDLLQLSEALKLAGPVASSVGADLELTAAALGTLGNSGIQASLAGTQLRGVFAALLAPTRQAATVIEQLADRLGVSADQFNVAAESADGVTDPLIRVLRLFRQAGTSATEFFQIFGRRQAAGAITLTEFVDQLEALRDANLESADAAKTLAEIQDNTLAGGFRRSVAALENLVLTAGDNGLLGVLRGLVEGFAEAVRIIAGVPGAFEASSATGQVLVGVLVTLTATLVGLGVGKIITLFVNLASAIRLVTSGTLTLNAALASNPFTAIAVGLSSIIGLASGVAVGLGATARAVREVDEAVEDLQRSRESLEALREQLDFARETSNSTKEVGLLRRELERLEQLGASLSGQGEGSFFERTVNPERAQELTRLLQDFGVEVENIQSLFVRNQSQFGGAGQLFPNINRQLPTEAGVDEQQQAVLAAVRARVAELTEEIRQLDAENRKVRDSGLAAFVEGEQKAFEFTDALRTQTGAIRAVAAELQRLEDIRGDQGLTDDDIAAAELAGRVFEARARAEAALGDERVQNLDEFLAGVEKEIRLQEVLLRSIRDVEDERERIQNSQRAREEGLDNVNDFIASLSEEVELLRLGNTLRAQETAVREAQRLVRQANADIDDERLRLELTSQQIEEIRELAAETERLRELQSERPRQRANLPRITEDTTLRPLREELEILQAIGTERRVLVELARLEQAFRQSGESPQDAERLAAARRAEVEALVERIELTQQLADVGAQAGQALGDALETIIFDGGKARDVIRGLIEEISRAAFRAFVTRQLTNALSGLGGGLAAGKRGLVGNGRRVLPLRRGAALDRGLSSSIAAGVVRNPTMVPQALIGEGPRAEGVFPLERERGGFSIMASIGGRRTTLPIGRLDDGNLGVQVQGFQTGGVFGSSTPAGPGPSPQRQNAREETSGSSQHDRFGRDRVRGRSVTVNQTITTPDPDAFRRSTRQNIAAAKRGARL